MLDSADPLGQLQSVHWEIHRGFFDYQTTSEARRQLAADAGELIRQLVDVLTAAGWSEHDARNANVSQLAHKGDEHDVADDDPVEEVLARSRDRAARLEALIDHLRGGDPAFAEASALYPGDMSEWQAGVYLLTGCDLVWSAVLASVLTDRSIGPVIRELRETAPRVVLERGRRDAVGDALLGRRPLQGEVPVRV